MANKINESDWKLFRDSLSDWREQYLKEKNKEIADILQRPGDSPTERFWSTKEIIDKEAQLLQKCLDGVSRSNMVLRILMMYRHNIIPEEDLMKFSDELQQKVRSMGDE